MQLFKKPKLEPKDYLANLQAEILVAERRFEELDGKYAAKSVQLEHEYAAKLLLLTKDTDALENSLAIKRSEYAQLSKPFEDRSSVLNEREKQLDGREETLNSYEQTVFQREHDTENKLQSVQELCNKVGETNIKQQVKEGILKLREESLKEKETEILAGLEHLALKRNEVSAELLKREEIVTLRELNVDSERENLVNREKQIEKDLRFIQDRKGIMDRNDKRLLANT